MRAWLLLVWLPALVRCGGANANCNSRTLIPAIITVTNGATSDAICDADVTATGPGGQFPLSASVPDAGACEYDGPVLDGSYTVTVSKSGFQSSTVPGVTVMTQTCDGPKPSPQVVRVTLTPS